MIILILQLICAVILVIIGIMTSIPLLLVGIIYGVLAVAAYFISKREQKK